MKDKRKVYPRLRRIVALFFFVGITLLFLDFTGTIHLWLGWMAKIQFLPALLALNAAVIIALVGLPLLVGRVYCSVICPLGVMQDGMSRLSGLRKKKKFRFSYSPEVKWLRYSVFALFIIAVILGIGSFVALLAPYSSYGRIVSNLFAPVYQWGNNVLAYIAERHQSYAFYEKDVWLRSLPTFIIAVITFVTVFILAWRNGRTYCNTVCPVGTILGFLSRFSLFCITIDTDKCNKCGLCSRKCKAACIDGREHKIDYSRCVMCMDCISTCTHGAIGLRMRHFGKSTVESVKNEPQAKVDSGRRGFLGATALVAATVAVSAQEKMIDGGLAVIEDKKIPVRKTPIVPAGAILKITDADKSSVQIGHAVWIKDNCVVMTDGVECGNCARHCPAGAIQMIALNPDSENSPRVPMVDPERCIGCGACENLCPARPFSAIYVEGHELHRTI